MGVTGLWELLDYGSYRTMGVTGLRLYRSNFTNFFLIHFCCLLLRKVVKNVWQYLQRLNKKSAEL